MTNLKEPPFFQYFLGNRQSFSLERRVFNALVLASSFLATLLVIEALVFHYKKALALSSIAAVIFWSLYFISLKHKNRDYPLWNFLAAIGLIVLTDWFFVGGQSGLALMVVLAIASTIPMIARTDQLKTTVLLLLGFYTIICTLTVFFWNYIPRPVFSKSHYLLDLAESGVLASCLCAVGFLAISSYRREKEMVSSLNLELLREKETLEKSHRKLQQAHNEIKTLRGLLPTCSYCKKIRPDNIKPNEAKPWIPIEKFIQQHTEALFSHGICPECTLKHFGRDLHDKVFRRPL